MENKVVTIREFIDMKFAELGTALKTTESVNDDLGKAIELAFRRHQIIGALTILNEIRGAMVDNVPIESGNVPVDAGDTANV
jgi:hypothetical protein